MITLEPLKHIVQDWPDEVKTCCAKRDGINEICNKKYGFLFGKS
jgi:hypothetical protein